jgi:tRNA pseudouridine38-40 synthase
MRTIKLTIEYDGTNYCGWQSQKDDPTIQDTLEATLARILNHPVRVTGSGRTDSGVHALGQVAHVRTHSSIALSSLQRGANSLLPPDVFIKAVEGVDEGFHARFSAKSRRYEYCVWNSPQPTVFRRKYVWWIREWLDVERMEAASRQLLGQHDFSSFQGADDEKVSPERAVMESGFRKEEAEVIFFIHANSFLRHMVRNIVGTLVDVGKKKITPADFDRILQARDRGQAGITAPPQGLFLTRVYY